MATTPNPDLELTDLKGTTRTLRQWSTIFQFCFVVLPTRPEAARWIPIARHIFKTFREANCHTAYLIPGPDPVARRLLGEDADQSMVFIDPDRKLLASLDLKRLPALVHLRQDTSLGASAEGWDRRTWQTALDEIAKSLSWIAPDLLAVADLPPSAGWELESQPA